MQMQMKWPDGGPSRLRVPVFITALAAVLIFALAARAQDAAPATAPAGASVDAPAAPRISVFELFQRGGPYMYALAACSVVAVAIIIERLVMLRRSQVIPSNFLTGLKQVFNDPREDRDRAIEYCQKHDSPMARMIAAGIRRMPRGVEAAEKAIEDAGANEALKLRRNLRFLYAIGSVATLLGLIGTISGMIRAFQVASVAGPGHAELLSKGIYEAMVNTFGGLAVAILVTIFYYFLVGRVERLISEMNDALSEFSQHYGFDAPPESRNGDEYPARAAERGASLV